jgi:hypothetical protein
MDQPQHSHVPIVERSILEQLDSLNSTRAWEEFHTKNPDLAEYLAAYIMFRTKDLPTRQLITDTIAQLMKSLHLQEAADMERATVDEIVNLDTSLDRNIHSYSGEEIAPTV